LHLSTLFGETEAEGSCDDLPSARPPFSLCMFLGLYASREELEEKDIPTDYQRCVFRSLYIATLHSDSGDVEVMQDIFRSVGIAPQTMNI
jgi:hypothetical protein